MPDPALIPTSASPAGAPPQLIPSVSAHADPLASLPSNPTTNLIPSQPAPSAGQATPAVTPTLSGAMTVQVGKDPTIAGVGANESVSGQLDKLLKGNSPYLDLARSQALQQSASRGLQNSTLAAGAGEAAAIGAATPIASADATINANRATTNLNAINQFGVIGAQSEAEKTRIAAQAAANSQLQKEAAAQNINQIITQGDVNSRLQAADQSFKAIQATLDRGQQLTLADQNFQNQQKLIIAQAAAQSGLSAQDQAQQLARMNEASQHTLDQIAAQAKANLLQYGPQLQSQYLQAVSARMQSMSQEIAAIYTQQGLTSIQQADAVANAQARMQTEVAAIQSYYQASPIWDPKWGSTGGVIPKAPPPPPTYQPPPGGWPGQPPFGRRG